MPLIQPATYQPPRFLGNAHLQTIWHSEFRRVAGVAYRRSRIDTPDGDFLDLDWLDKGRQRLALLVHGLESASSRAYMKGMAKALVRRGFDCLAMSLRGCGGQINRRTAFYHAGKTDDLETTLQHVFRLGRTEIYLIGFSLGGNIVLRWLGEQGDKIDRRIIAAAAVSAPCDLVSSNQALNKPSKRLYNRRFVNKLTAKVRAKAAAMPGTVDTGFLIGLKTLEDFDEAFTARQFGFSGAQDYYRRASARPLLKRISVPTLLLNAQDDPFLGPDCFPWDIAQASGFLFLEAPEHGGHIGFLTGQAGGEYWHETRVSDFFTAV